MSEVIHIFVHSQVSSPVVLPKTLSKINDGAILLPYLRGPKVDGVPNIRRSVASKHG